MTNVPAHSPNCAERCPLRRRPRRRGPRSLGALQRRALCRFTPSAGVLVSGPHVPRAPAGVSSLNRRTSSVTRSPNTVFHTPSPCARFCDNDCSLPTFSESQDGTAGPNSGFSVRASASRPGQNLGFSSTPGSTQNSPNLSMPPGGRGVPRAQSRATTPQLATPHVNRLRMWSINARKLLRRKAELEARLTNSGDLAFRGCGICDSQWVRARGSP